MPELRKPGPYFSIEYRFKGSNAFMFVLLAYISVAVVQLSICISFYVAIFIYGLFASGRHWAGWVSVAIVVYILDWLFM